MKLLKAFLVPEKGTERQALTQELPVYMQPKAFCVLLSLPINEHGKLDRKELENR